MDDPPTKRQLQNGSGDDIDDIAKKRQKNDNELEKTITQSLDEYVTEITVIDTYNTDEEYKRNVEELQSFRNVDYKSYCPGSHLMIERPINKILQYRKMTKTFGYEFNKENAFLRRGGILDVLDLEKPFFCFWEHGLEFFTHKNAFDINEKYQKFLIKRISCSKHEFKCPHPEDVGPDDQCKIVKDCMPSGSVTFLITGTLRMRINNEKKFKSFHIQLENGQRIDAPNGIKIADQISIGSDTTVHIINACDHEKCDLGEQSVIEGMPKIYNMCKNIMKNQRLNDIKIDVNMKRVYLYGKGLSGKYYRPTGVTYLTTYEVIDMYIVNY